MARLNHEPIIRIRGLTKVFDGKRVLDELDYTWFEEPIRDQHLTQLKRLADDLRVPILATETAHLYDIPEYLRHRINMQKEFLVQIDDTFSGEVLTSVPEFERDITGLEMIGKVADALFGSIKLAPAGGEA